MFSTFQNKLRVSLFWTGRLIFNNRPNPIASFSSSTPIQTSTMYLDRIQDVYKAGPWKQATITILCPAQNEKVHKTEFGPMIIIYVR